MVDQFSLTLEEKGTLLSLARESIEYGCEHHKPLLPQGTFDETLMRVVGCFVTLTIEKQLRGCIGTLEPWRPLIEDVCENAFSAAFHDRRFAPLRSEELPRTHIEISVLSPLVEMHFDDELDFLNQLVPFDDGIVLEEGDAKATFLPLVWEQLPDKQSFMAHLKQKAGLSPKYWSNTVRCFRYHTLVFEETTA